MNKMHDIAYSYVLKLLFLTEKENLPSYLKEIIYHIWIQFVNCILFFCQEQKKIGVIAASAGNHALALCYHGADLGIPVTVVMPLIAPLMKVQNCKTYGAEVIIHGKGIFEVHTLP